MRTVMVSRASVSSRMLAKRLGIRRIIVGRRATPFCDALINWGCSDMPPPPRRILTVYNRPECVQVAVDKKATFAALKAANVPTVDWTTDIKTAQGWLDKGSTVYGRQLTRSSGGEGISLYLAGKHDGPIANAPLYTRFYKCDREVRVHVVGDQVIDFSEKRRDRSFVNDGTPRYWIRTHSNGWIYAREGAKLTDSEKATAVLAVRALGLDYGAVDMRVRAGGGCAVLEVNSAPGITGSTLDSYEEAFKNILRVA
jgi:hypothetical protein